MATAVETLEKLERRITLTVPLAEVNQEVEKRLKVRARTAKFPGFRPGKAPLKMVAAQFGAMVESEVLNDKVGRAFSDVTADHNLRVAGFPRIEPKIDEQVDGALVFQATFEIYPEVKLGDLAGIEVEKSTAQVTEAEIDKTIDILRRQRVHYHTKGEAGEHGDGGPDASAHNGDRVTIDFVGKIDGVEFSGGKGEDFPFLLGEGQMLKEFEDAVLGMKQGESKTFPLTFPEDYHGKEVAGKTAEFTITLKKVEWAHMPDIDSHFAETLGVAGGDLQQMRDDIRANLEREVGNRIKAKTKTSVLDALVKVVDLEVPKTLLEQDAERLAEFMRQDMRQRGIQMQDLPISPDMFNEQAERRVRIGLIMSELVKANALQATGEQVRAWIDDFAKAYENPQQVVNHYLTDRNRLADVEAMVVEQNVVDYVLSKAKVTEKQVPFDELMNA
ncbi:MAG: trigger factor [Burkholderiaceae bacterium]